MEKMMSVLRTLKNHWKKSVCLGLVIGFGGAYGKDKYRISVLMRAYCEEAKQYGDQTVQANAPLRHVTVILNPSAKDGKAKSLFEKYSLPLLHLAGMKISIVQTDREGQTRDLMQIMENTDAVVIAGGNGTVHEAVTGLLRRMDHETALCQLPLGVIPVGKTNTLAKSLFRKQTILDEHWIAEATMSLVRGYKKAVDVMKIEGYGDNPIFAVANVEMGVFRETETTIPKYWYLGPMKSKFAYILRTFSEWPPSRDVDVSYILPCSGCSTCFKPAVSTQKARRWWEAFVPRTPNPTTGLQDYSKLINENCGQWHNQLASCSEMIVSANRRIGYKDNPSSLDMDIYPGQLTRMQFINRDRADDDIQQSSIDHELISAREIKLVPKVSEDDQVSYSIDNENYEARPIHIMLLPKKVYVYSKE